MLILMCSFQKKSYIILADIIHTSHGEISNEQKLMA